LEQVHKATGVLPKPLAELPRFPEDIGYLWELYNEVRTEAALTYTEVASWLQVTGVQLEGWEVRVLKLLDRVVLKVARNG
jgi:hypothetical protein